MTSRVENYSHKKAIAANQNVNERNYWLNKLSGGFVKSRFPYDYKKENENPGVMDEGTVEFSSDIFEKLKKLSSGIDVKLHMILVSGLAALLYKYSGSKDITIGSPITKQDIEGEFINTILVYRIQLQDIMNFKELILQVRETIIQAVENQNYPLELLPGLLNLPVLKNEFPLFDIALLLENIHEKSYLEGIHYHLLFSFHRLENRIEFSLEYDSLLYQERTIKQITDHYTHLLETALSDVNVPLAHIDILSEAEKQQLVKEFNAKKMEFPEEKTFHQLFEEQVERTSDHIAVIGMGHGAWGMASISYNQLNEKSNQLAWVLREKGVQPDNVVGLMVDRSIEMIIGILGILKSGGAYLPIDPDYPEERIRYMLVDSGARVLLTDLPERHNFNCQLSIVNYQLSTSTASHSLTHLTHLTQPTHLCYVIYTSGSTGKPKGVLVEHRNVVANLSAFLKEFKITPQDTMIQLSSYTFDAFIEEVFPLLVSGGKIAIPPDRNIMDMEELALFTQQHQVTIIDCTPLLLNEFNKMNPSYLASVRFFISGGDILKPGYVDRLAKQGTLYNTYGPTEATVCTSYYKCPEDGQSNVPIGKPISNYYIYILDNHSRLLPIGAAGELCISGAGVSRGYLNNPELTAEKFLDLAAKANEDTRNSSFIIHHSSFYSLYRTGDLARWLPDGNIEFLGRIDNQVKVRGFRIELGEIENKLLEHASIKQAVVVEKITENDDKYLCGYVISGNNLEPEDLREFLGKKLPDYMVPWFFVQLEQFPLTPTGKIDRKALPEPETSGDVRYVAPRNETEEKLVELWAHVLGEEKGEIGIDSNFFDLGGNSLKAIILTTKMHKELNVKLQMTQIFKLQTIRGISELINEISEEAFIPIEPAEKKEYYRLSPAQKRLYILQQMKLNSTAYNMPLTVEIQAGLEKEKLKTIFCKLIERHESLRTSFEMIKREPVQRIHHKVEFRIECYDMARTQVEAEGGKAIQNSKFKIQNSFVEPFDLSRAPLFRVGLMKTVNERYLLMVDIHHIISDGISHQILINDFLALDEGKTLPSLRIQYKDFSEWQNRDKQKEVVKMQEAYWLKQFESGIPILNLPADYPRDEVEGYEGSSIRFEIGVEETKALRQMILAEDTTMFMLLLAVYYVLFLNLGGQEGIVIGTVVAGRNHSDLEQVIGMFVNTLALINYPQKEKTFAEFLQEVKKRVLDAFENQDYQFEDLVDKVVVKRNPGRHPLFDVMFTFQTSEPTADKVNEKVFENLIPTAAHEQSQFEYETIDRTAKFDLTFNGVDAGEKLFFEVEYSTKLFKKETIQRYVRYFKEILSCALENKETQLKGIKISHDLYEAPLDNPQIDFGF